jgi:hypothetical protein
MKRSRSCSNTTGSCKEKSPHSQVFSQKREEKEKEELLSTRNVCHSTERSREESEEGLKLLNSGCKARGGGGGRGRS